MAQRQDRAADGFEMRIPAQVAELHGVRRALVSWLDGRGAPPEVGAEVALAVHEAAANAVEHAYPRGPGELMVRAVTTTAASSWSSRMKATGDRRAAPISGGVGSR